MEKNRFFQTLDAMNVADTENKTQHVVVCPNLVSADYSYSLKGTKITMGSPGNIAVDLMTGKTVPLLLLINKEEYDKILNQPVACTKDHIEVHQRSGAKEIRDLDLITKDKILQSDVAQLDRDSVKARKWDALDEKISKFYPEDPEAESSGDLMDIGETAARAFGYL